VIMFIFDDDRLLNKDFPKINYYEKFEPNYKKQVILREFCFFELLIKILDKLNSDQLILQKKKDFIGSEDKLNIYLF